MGLDHEKKVFVSVTSSCTTSRASVTFSTVFVSWYWAQSMLCWCCVVKAKYEEGGGGGGAKGGGGGVCVSKGRGEGGGGGHSMLRVGVM